MPLTLPVVTLPVTVNVPSVPMVVILGCVAVANVPLTIVNVPLAPLTLPVETLPAMVNAFGVVHTPSYMVKLP